MTKIRKVSTVLLTALIILSSVVLGGCGVAANSNTTASKSQELKIGVLEPQTGPLAESGSWVINGVKLAEKDVNAQGGVEIGGTKYLVKLEIIDTASTANGALAGFQKLVGQVKVPVILGTMATDETAAVMPEAEKKKIPMLSSISAGDILTQQGWKFFFRGGAYNSMGLKSGIDVVKNQFKAKKAVLLVANDTWGKGYETIWPPALKSAGIDLISTEKYELDQRDYSAVLNKIKGLNPDVLVLGARSEHALPIFTQAHQIMPAMKMYELGGSIPEQIVKSLGKEATEGLVFASRNGPEGPNVQVFQTKYKEAYNKDANSWNYSAYDSLMIMLDAMKRAATVSDGEKIREAILKSDYDGLVGKYTFQPNGENNLRGPIAYVHDGVVTRQWADEPLPSYLFK